MAQEQDAPVSATGLVAIVDDDAAIRMVLRKWLTAAGHRVIEIADGRAAIDQIGDEVAVTILDLGLGDVTGMHVLAHLRAKRPDSVIIVGTGERALDTAVEAMRAGAYDYLVKPFDQSRVTAAVGRAMERFELAGRVRKLQTALEERQTVGSVVGQSAPMREVNRQVERVLESDVSVCLLGESGTGKEVVARSIHGNGRRKRGPFVAINCGAIPASLQESELFGHERGAFTGASGVHKGRFEQADGGTLFLDEIGEMSPATQASVLRALQERSIRRVGGSTEIPVNVRIICATHRNLDEEVKSGRFREDLYFRLVVFPIRLPPLRERAEDVPLLIGHFLQRLAPDVGRAIARISPDALAALSAYHWPGNVRELQNVVHRAMLACDGDEIELAHLPPEIRQRALPVLPAPLSAAVDAADGEDGPILPLRELERRAIARALKASGGSVEKAARMLGMGRATLYRRLASGQSEPVEHA
jgi:DNA-binding NtrC family response regulator